MQIVSIQVKGFQSHVDSTFNLGPQLNVITGPSGSGKTSGAIRAVRWVAFNEPTGEAFLREEGGEAEVTLTLDNGTKVTKQRKNRKTRYFLTGFDEPFEKAEVPQEVKQALGLEKQTFGDFETALNFSYQLEAPFILSETASAGAKILGKLAGTEVVDLAVRAVSKDTHAARLERSAADKDIERVNGELLHYQNLDEIRQQLESCEYLLSVIDERLARKERLEGQAQTLAQAEEQLERVAQTLERLAVVPELQQDLVQIEKAQQRYDTLLDLYSQLGGTTATVERLTRELMMYEGVEAAAVTLTVIIENSERLASFTSLFTLYTNYAKSVVNADKELVRLSGIDVAAGDLERIEAHAQRGARLRQLAAEWNYSLGLQAGAEHQLNALQVIDGVSEGLAAVEVARDRLMTLRSLRTLYRLAQTDVAAATMHVDEAISGIAKADAELARVWEDAGGICPLCDLPHERGVTHA